MLQLLPEISTSCLAGRERERASGKCKIGAMISPDTTRRKKWLSSIISLRKQAREL